MKIHHRLLICVALLTLAGSSRAVAAEAIFLAEVQLSSETGAGPTKPLAISNDGRWVLLSSRAPNLIASQVEGNNEEDLFLYDRVLHQPELISHRAFEPSRTANEPSNRPISKQAKMSPDGEWVIFTSRADDLIVGTSDDLFSEDAFLWQRSSGQLTLISHQVGRPLAAAGQSRAVALTPDGAFVLFESQATSLVAGVVDTNNSEDVFSSLNVRAARFA